MLSFDFFSPEQPLAFSQAKEKGLQVFIKRDDLIHPFISGNKWRKLKYNLQEAQRQGKDHLVTFGGAWSNHLLATACAGASFGLQTTGFVRGEEGVNNPVLALCKLYGMQLVYVERETYKDKAAIFTEFLTTNPKAYFIDEGGYGMLAAKGCEEIIAELQQEYDHIFCACGTGTTIAGLANALTKRPLKTVLHGIPVLKNGDFIRQEVEQLSGQKPTTIQLHLDYHFGGYAKIKPELIRFTKEFVRQTGIMIEPTYSGKLFYGVMDLIENDYFNSNDKILIIHTGGLTGFLGVYEKF